MHQFDITHRIRYGDTDKMGFLYYGNYAYLYEIGRTESLRSLGLSYKDMEDSGVGLPVIELSSKFIKPILYDDVILIRTITTQMPKVRIHFKYELFNQKDELVNIGETTLVFINYKTYKPTMCPDNLIEALTSFF